MNKEELVIPYDSDEAAQIKTVTGWVDRQGRFWGENEDQARYCGSTHQLCKGNPEHGLISKHYHCEVCSREREINRHMKLEVVDWNGEAFLYEITNDRYFSDPDDILDFCEENGVRPSELLLEVCTPNYAREIDGNDYFYDDLPEDGEIPNELQEAFEKLNEVIRKAPPLSYSPGGKQRVVLKDEDFFSQEELSPMSRDREND